MFGHLGVEWDLTEATPAERRELASWIELYKQHRALIHTGRVVRRSLEDDALWLHGAIAPDAGEALYSAALRERPVTWPLGKVRLPGLDRDRSYVVRALGAGEPYDPRIHPAWWNDGVVLTGAVLADIGLHLPALQPDHAVLLHVVAGADRAGR